MGGSPAVVISQVAGQDRSALVRRTARAQDGNRSGNRGCTPGSPDDARRVAQEVVTMSDTLTTTSTGNRLLLRWVVVLLLVGALAMAISTGVGSSTGTVRDGQLEIELAGYRIDPPTLVLRAGEDVTLVLTNTSTYHHNVAIGREPVRLEGRTVGFGQDLLAVSASQAEPARALITPRDPGLPTTVSVAPGTTVRVDVRIPEELVGEWELGCFQGSGCEARIDEPATLRVE